MQLKFILRGFLPRQFNTPGLTKHIVITREPDDKYHGCLLFFLDNNLQAHTRMCIYKVKRVG